MSKYVKIRILPVFFKLAELPKSTQYITTAIIFNKLSKENLNFIIE